MQHMTNSMIGGVSVWYMDSKASNHMTSHGEWFKNINGFQTSIVMTFFILHIKIL
jgi:hypothetical protein